MLDCTWRFYNAHMHFYMSLYPIFISYVALLTMSVTVSKNFLIHLCACRFLRQSWHIVKVFFASPCLKCGRFLLWRMARNNTHFSIDPCSGISSANPVLRIYPSVGYCAIYFQYSLSTTFEKIHENQLYTFFVYPLYGRWSCGSQLKQWN